MIRYDSSDETALLRRQLEQLEGRLAQVEFRLNGAEFAGLAAASITHVLQSGSTPSFSQSGHDSSEPSLHLAQWNKKASTCGFLSSSYETSDAPASECGKKMEQESASNREHAPGIGAAAGSIDARFKAEEPLHAEASKADAPVDGAKTEESSKTDDYVEGDHGAYSGEPANDSKDRLSKSDATSIESEIGLYWLSKFGIGFLVVGMAFLISYSFQFFGPLEKISAGFVIAASLIGLGEYLDKAKTAAFGRVLAGGGWALSFFTCFAMHHIESVRMIDNPIVAFVLMTGITCGAVLHAVGKRSELMSVLAILLGFITISLTPAAYFSAAAFCLLGLISAYLSTKMHWRLLHFVGLVASYSCFGLLVPSIENMNSSNIAKVLLASSYLLPAWLGNLWTGLNFSEEKAAERVMALSTAVINSIVFLALWLPLLVSNAISISDAYLFTGLVHLFCSYVAQKLNRPAMATLHTIAGLSLSTMYLPSVLNHDCTLLAMSIETGVLVATGLRYGIRGFRWFAILMALCSFIRATGELFAVPAGFQQSLFPIICQWSLLGAWVTSLFLYGKRELQKNSSAAEKETALYTYITLAAFLGSFIPVAWAHATLPSQIEVPAVAAFWSLLSLAGTVSGIKLRRIYPAILSTGGLLLAYLASCFTSDPTQVATAVAVGCMYGAPLACHRWRFAGPPWTVPVFYVQLCIAWLATVAFIFQAAPDALTPIFIAIQGFILLLWGLLNKQRGLRWLGLSSYVLSLVAMLLTTASWTCTIAMTLLMYLTAVVFGKNRMLQESGESSLQHSFSIAGSTILVFGAGELLSHGWISCCWAMHATLLLACGFAFKNKCLRISALTIFALVASKLLFVDLAGANQLHRIMAFIFTGVALLCSSFAYTWFSKLQERSCSADFSNKL